MTPETAEPSAPEPQQPQQPQADEPRAEEPETGEPETGEPETGEPETGEPETGEPQAEAPAPRRPRTVRLLVGALLLGPLLGGGIGYAIQAGRPETPLPPLQVSAPKYPSTVVDAKAAADAAPKPLNIDGDLRKLLISKPGDAQDWDNYGHGDSSGWISIGEKAMTYGGASREFSTMLTDGFRRDAITTWQKNNVRYRVELIQYDADHVTTAVAAVQMNLESDSHPLDGTATGLYSVPPAAKTYADSTEKYYFGLALARRGDVVMRISVYSPNQVNVDELKDIAKRQWERLV